MVKDNSFEKKVGLVFASFPNAKSFHFTSDGQAFTLDSDAKNHAKTLEDKEVREISKSMALSGQMDAEMPILKQVQDDTKGAKNEFQAQGTVREVALNGEPGEGVPYGTDDQGRNVSEIATDVANKIQDNVAKATEGSVTDSSDAKQQAKMEAKSAQAPEKGGSTATSAPAPEILKDPEASSGQDDAPAKGDAPANPAVKKSSSTAKKK